jgi:hypothetical protein
MLLMRNIKKWTMKKIKNKWYKQEQLDPGSFELNSPPLSCSLKVKVRDPLGFDFLHVTRLCGYLPRQHRWW